MTELDLHRIETELTIQLPAEYRTVMVAFPIRFERGNSRSLLWDDADSLIRQNQELRTLKKSAWPPHFFFIGGDVECSSVLDLRQSPCRVVEVDHWDTTGYGEPYSDALSFTDWLNLYLDDYQKDGIDLTSEEDPVRPIPAGWIYVVAAFFVAILVAGSVIGLIKIIGD
jgi:hypothetical protein